MRRRDAYCPGLKPLAVLGAYILLACVMTYPWLRHFTTHTPDGGGESSFALWNLLRRCPSPTVPYRWCIR